MFADGGGGFVGWCGFLVFECVLFVARFGWFWVVVWLGYLWWVVRFADFWLV